MRFAICSERTNPTYCEYRNRFLLIASRYLEFIVKVPAGFTLTDRVIAALLIQIDEYLSKTKKPQLLSNEQRFFYVFVMVKTG